jgi:hypothetical protein
MSEGAVISTALALAAEIGIADLLAEGPRSSEALAQATSTHPQSLYRVLRLLSAVGVFTEMQPRTFALTPLGQLLRNDIPGSMRSWLRMVNLKVWLQTFPQALYSLYTGEPALKQAVGVEFFDYLAAHPEEGEIFHAAMNDITRGSTAAILQAYDFSGMQRVIDVGGGHGWLVMAILHAYPEMTGVLLDLPHVAEEARRTIAEAGLAGRCEIVAGDFFHAVPADGDAYLLKWIIHDWDQERALLILKNCRQAMKPTARLLLLETVIPAGDTLHPGKFEDFVMLTGLGGQERTEEEYAHLLVEAGFRLNRIVPTDSPMNVIEAIPG